MLKRRLQNNNLYRRDQNNQYAFNNENFPNITQNTVPNLRQNNNNNSSYSDVLQSKQPNNPFEKIEKLIENQIELTNKLIGMMSVLITKLCG